MASNIRIIKLKRKNDCLVIGKLKYVTPSHYYLKRLDRNTSVGELYATVSNLDRGSFEKLAEELKNKKVSTESADAV